MSAATLSGEQVETFQRDGFLRVGRVFDRRRFESIRRRIHQIVDELPVGAHREKMLNWHLHEPWLLRLALRHEILRRVIALIGPDLALFNTRILAKPAGAGRAVPWHQDAPYWPLDPPVVVTFWLAIDDATADNGAMRMLPAMHRRGALEHVAVDAERHVFDEAIRPDLVDEENAVLLDMAAGEASLHDGFTPHASGPNRSERRRTAFIARYIPTSSTLDRSRRELYGDSYPLYWIQGEPAANHYVNR